MKKLFMAAVFITAGTSSASIAADADIPPPWAWGLPPLTPGVAPTPAPAVPIGAGKVDPATPYTVPGSKRTYTATQVANRHDIADWFPEDHAPMPPFVSHGRESA